MAFATRDFSSSFFDAKILKKQLQQSSLLEANSDSHFNPSALGVGLHKECNGKLTKIVELTSAVENK